MRTAKDIVEDYRKRGYCDDRLRTLANGRAEPVRSEILAYIESNPAEAEVAREAELFQDELLSVNAGGEIESLPGDLPETEMELAEDEYLELEEDPEEEAAVETPVVEIEDEPVAEEEPEVLCEIEEPANTVVEDEPVCEEADEITEIDFEEDEVCAHMEESGEADIMEATVAEALAVETETSLASSCTSLDEVIEKVESKVLAEAEKSKYKLATSFLAAVAENMCPVEVSRLSAEQFVQMQEAEDQLALAAETAVFPAAELDKAVAIPESAKENLLAASGDRAARRSLEVINSMREEDEVSLEESNIIELVPPYAEERQSELHLVEFNEAADAKLMENEESSLIRFPSEVMATYDAIHQCSEPLFNNAKSGREDVTVEELVAAITTGEYESNMNAGEVAQAEVASASEEAIEAEISALRNWLTELEDTIRLKEIESLKLADLVNEREETLDAQAREIEELRQQLAAGAERLNAVAATEHKYSAVANELEQTREKLAAMENEYNVLAQVTVPDLRKDREDLLDVLESQSAEKNMLEGALSKSGRRVALGYTAGVAAMFLMVMSFTFHWIQTSRQSETFRNDRQDLTAQLDAQKNTLAQLQQTKAELEKRAENELAMWKQRTAQLTRRIEEQSLEVARIRHELGTRTAGTTVAVVPRDNRATIETSVGNPGGVTHRNEVRGIADYMTRSRDRATVAESSKKAVVRTGEGISHVLWRELGTTNSNLIEWVAKKNELVKSPHGYWIIRPGQELLLPNDPAAVTGSADAGGAAANIN